MLQRQGDRGKGVNWSAPMGRGFPWPTKEPGPHTAEASDASTFERLVHLVQDNARLFRELEGLAVRAQRARFYLLARGSNSALGLAFLDRARARHAAALLRLRANRVEACELLGPGFRSRKTIATRRTPAS